MIMCQKVVPVLFILFFSTTSVLAQQNFTVSGTVKEKASGETLTGATITVVEKPGVGVSTNEYGFYSLSLPKGNYTLRFSYVGRKQELLEVNLESNITASITLTEESA